MAGIDIGPGINIGPGISIGAAPPVVNIPTLDITANSLGQYTGSITFNITSDGGGTVLETGVIYGLPGQTTYAISVDTCTGSSSTAERTAKAVTVVVVVAGSIENSADDAGLTIFPALSLSVT